MIEMIMIEEVEAVARKEEMMNMMMTTEDLEEGVVVVIELKVEEVTLEEEEKMNLAMKKIDMVVKVELRVGIVRNLLQLAAVVGDVMIMTIVMTIEGRINLEMIIEMTEEGEVIGQRNEMMITMMTIEEIVQTVIVTEIVLIVTALIVNSAIETVIVIEDKKLILKMIEIVDLLLQLHLQEPPVGETGMKNIEVGMRIRKHLKNGRLPVVTLVVWWDLALELVREILVHHHRCQQLNWIFLI